MKTVSFFLTIVGFATLMSCNHSTENSRMMHNNGDSYYWGMHMGWWFFALLIIIILIMVFINFKKRK